MVKWGPNGRPVSDSPRRSYNSRVESKIRFLNDVIVNSKMEIVIYGRLQDYLGYSIANALIEVYDNGNLIRYLRTSDNGRFTFKKKYIGGYHTYKFVFPGNANFFECSKSKVVA